MAQVIHRPEQRKQGSVREVIEVAVRLFARKGFDGTGIDEILREAGVSKGAFYYHFRSKEELLREIHDAFAEYQLGKAEEIAATDLAPQQKLARIIQMSVETIATYQAHVRVFFQELRLLSGDTFETVRSKRDRLEGIIRRLVQDCMREGSFRTDFDPKLATLLLFGMTNWTYQWYRRGGTWQPKDVSEAITAIFFGGMASRGEVERCP